MRRTVALLSITALAACGVAADVHQKALDDAKLAQDALEQTRSELASVKVQLKDAQERLQASEKRYPAIKARLRRAELQRFYNAVTLRVRRALAEAQNKTYDKAASLAARANDMLLSLKDEKDIGAADEELDTWVKSELQATQELIASARQALGTPKDAKAVAAAQESLKKALEKLESLVPPASETLERILD